LICTTEVGLPAVPSRAACMLMNDDSDNYYDISDVVDGSDSNDDTSDNVYDYKDAGDDTVFQIDMEEYGVALDLAWQYSLDSDLVYQRQWRNSPVSVTSIQDYLVSIQLRLYSTRLFYNC